MRYRGAERLDDGEEDRVALDEEVAAGPRDRQELVVREGQSQVRLVGVEELGADVLRHSGHRGPWSGVAEGCFRQAREREGGASGGDSAEEGASRQRVGRAVGGARQGEGGRLGATRQRLVRGRDGHGAPPHVTG
jgi:hypothetical protein